VPDTYAIDSNVYIRALRNVAQLGELQGFLKLFGRRVGLAGVVSMELRAGASTPAHVEAVESLVGAYFQRNRMIAASAAGHREAGRVLAALVEHEGVVLAQAPRSLTADVLLAVCCREHDVVLITDNHRDFVPIQRHLRGFRCIAPWPAAPRLHR
jgi:predicted nucleic acid-binding protein